MPRVPDVLRMLTAFAPDAVRPAQDSYRRTVSLLRTAEAPFERTAYAPGHCTASAVVLSPAADAVLLVWHERLSRWLQPGGHFEPEDADPLAAALREAREETGLDLAGVAWRLVGVDVHPIPAARGEPAHWHHDLVFGFRLTDPPAAGGAGTARTMWCPVEELAARGADDALRRAAARARLALSYSM